jgi:L-fuculose-phosphate aldolase
VIHFHSPYATALAMTRQPIPASHYSIAAFGGSSVEVADYACYGTAALAQNVVKAMDKRVACLIANHGALVVAETIEAALARAEMLEALARYHVISLQIGGPVLLSDADIQETMQANASYKFGVD